MGHTIDSPGDSGTVVWTTFEHNTQRSIGQRLYDSIHEFAKFLSKAIAKACKIIRTIDDVGNIPRHIFGDVEAYVPTIGPIGFVVVGYHYPFAIDQTSEKVIPV
jgi:hypothetical protein